MTSAFVKGLMCATLLHLGASSSIALISGLTVASLFWHIPGILALALALALLLFTRSSVVARTAFGFLLFFALLNIGVPIWTTIAHIVPPTPNVTSLFYGFLYAFPCIVAILTSRHGSQDV
jgi:hypothetical protein